eukprot:3699144-Pleurochrysis_carterae.AAC.1
MTAAGAPSVACTGRSSASGSVAAPLAHAASCCGVAALVPLAVRLSPARGGGVPPSRGSSPSPKYSVRPPLTLARSARSASTSAVA